MGSNQSKPIKDQERDDKENQFHDPALIDHLRTKKMKTTVFTINEKSTADEDMQNSTRSARRKQKPANNTKGSEVVKRKEHGRENGTNHRDENGFARNHFITDTNVLNMNVDMPDGFKSKQEDISEEKNVMDACGSEKDDEELEANIANDAESNASRSAHDNKYSVESAIHPSQESAPYKYEAPSTKDQKDDVDNTPKHEMDTVTSAHHFKSNDITSAESEIGTSGCSITFDGKSSLLRTTVCEESQSQSKSKLQNNTSSELPEPNLMQDTSRAAVNTEYASVSCMVTSLSSLASSNTVLSTSYTPLFSNVDTVSSNSSLSSQSILTQSSAFGNFSYSGNRLSSDTTSSLSHSTNNSTDGFRYGNFSMNSSAPAADGSSYVSNGSLRSSIIPSNSQFDFTQRFRHSPNVYDSQTGVPAGSSTNSLSGVIRNSITRNSDYESPNSHTSLSFDTSTVSNLTSVYLANSSNYVLRNWNGLENDVETDSLDLYDDETIAQQLYWSSYNNSRDTHVVDGDFITIRTSVGDTTTRISSKNITLNENFVGNDLTDENMGIILERPKYPRYSTLASREKSFENVWPATNKMSWEKLPEAGFVYTG